MSSSDENRVAVKSLIFARKKKHQNTFTARQKVLNGRRIIISQQRSLKCGQQMCTTMPTKVSRTRAYVKTHTHNRNNKRFLSYLLGRNYTEHQKVIRHLKL